MQSGTTNSAGVTGRLAAAHDAITGVGFGASAACLAVITVSFCYEVVSRYFLAAPTEWASPVVSFALCVMIFLTMPEITRTAAHIAINIIVDSASPANAVMLRATVRVIAAVACLLAAWFSASETFDQFSQDIWTSPPMALPKWTISVFVPYGMLSSGIYFVRHLVSGGPGPLADGASR